VSAHPKRSVSGALQTLRAIDAHNRGIRLTAIPEAAMDAYHLALFLHVATLIVAASATAVTKLAVARRIRARTVRDALEWHDLLISTSKVFPICLASFTVTGAYMVSVLGARAWSSGFVISGLVGVTFLLGSGTYLGIKANSLRGLLAGAANAAPDAPPPRLVPPPLLAMLPLINSGVALGVVFDMVTKPSSVLVSMGVIVVGIAVTAALAQRNRPRPAGTLSGVGGRALPDVR
jgi:hypothetical protein